jgi:hypothetical protein
MRRLASLCGSRGNRRAQSRATSARKPGLAAASQQVADLRDGQQLGVAAGRREARPGRNCDDPGSHQVIDQPIDADEQVLGGHQEPAEYVPISLSHEVG